MWIVREEVLVDTVQGIVRLVTEAEDVTMTENILGKVTGGARPLLADGTTDIIASVITGVVADASLKRVTLAVTAKNRLHPRNTLKSRHTVNRIEIRT
jgi:hypothetical protein